MTNLVKKEFGELNLPDLVGDVVVDRFLVGGATGSTIFSPPRGGENSGGAVVVGLAAEKSFRSQKSATSHLLVTKSQLAETSEALSDECAKLVGLCEKTVQKYCGEEIERGKKLMEAEGRARLKQLETELKGELNFARRENGKLRKQVGGAARWA